MLRARLYRVVLYRHFLRSDITQRRYQKALKFWLIERLRMKQLMQNQEKILIFMLVLLHSFKS